MKYNRRIHTFSHVLKAIIGNFFSLSIFSPKNQLIVLNYHGTQIKFIDNFIYQIHYLKKKYEIITPTQFEELILLKNEVKGKKVLLTFDDGIKNNLYAINELNKLGISVYLFAVPGFINTSKEEQKFFFIRNIRPTIIPEIDSRPEDFMALSWDELIEISKNHTIGSHTYSHTMLKNVLDEKKLKEELIQSKTVIENKIGIKVNSFCSINNTLLTIGKKESEIVQHNYQYHFTTFGGNNLEIDPFLIKRINVECYWLKGAFKFALSPFEFYRWNKKILGFKHLIK